MRLTVALLLLLAAAPALAQGTTLSNGRTLCFGVSFDRGCDVMVQYELGYRAPVVGHGPRLRQRWEYDDNKWRDELFLGAGVMYARGPRDALGAVADVGTSGPFGTGSLGVRWAHQLRETARIDLTAGVLAKPMHRFDPVDSIARERRFASVGVFTDASLHVTNFFTLTARPELHLRSGRTNPSAALLVGGRAEGRTAVGLTIVLALLYELAAAAYGDS